MDRTQLIEKIEQYSVPVLRDLGFILVDTLMVHEVGRWVLRLKIDHQDAHGPESHVSLDDCTRVSRSLSAVLEVEAQIPMAYTLEVSSPGLDRRLRSPADFERFAGSQAEVRTKHPLEGSRVFHGTLGHMEHDEVIITVDQRPRHIPWALIEKAKLRY